MVFENLTLFEVHLDDARFGTETGRPSPEDAPLDEAVDSAAGAGSEDAVRPGRSRFVTIAVASVVVSAVVAVAARRRAGGDDDAVSLGVEAETVSEAVDADDATAAPSESSATRDE